MSATLSNRTNATLKCTLSAAEFAQKLFSTTGSIAFIGEFEGETFDAEVTIDKLKRASDDGRFVFTGEIIVTIATYHCSKQGVGSISIDETGTVVGYFNLKPSSTLRSYASFDEACIEPSPETLARLALRYDEMAGVQD